jgi:hypothetical protein
MFYPKGDAVELKPMASARDAARSSTPQVRQAMLGLGTCAAALS